MTTLSVRSVAMKSSVVSPRQLLEVFESGHDDHAVEFRGEGFKRRGVRVAGPLDGGSATDSIRLSFLLRVDDVHVSQELEGSLCFWDAFRATVRS